MIVVPITEHPAHPLGKLVRPHQSVRLHDLALGVDPLGLYGVKPRALLRKKTTHDPHALPALLDVAIVLPEPSPYLFGDVPRSVVPDEEQHLLADLFEFFQAPAEKLGRYGTDGPAVDETQPRLLVDLGQAEPIAGDGLRIGIVFSDRLLHEAQRLALLAPTVQSGQGQPTPPALVHKTHRPLRVGLCDSHQPVASEASLFSFVEGVGGGDPPLGPHPPHRKQARQGSPDGLPRDALFGEPFLEGDIGGHLQSPKARGAPELPRGAVEHPPQGLGALLVESAMDALGSRGARGEGVETTFVEGSDGVPDRLRGASEVFGYLRGRLSSDARNIWHRRITKASLERSPASSRSRSSFDSSRTKIGGFMRNTIAHLTRPSLRRH